jgi:hypothetical protein
MSEAALEPFKRFQTQIEDVIGASIDEALSTQPENPIVAIAAALLKRCKVESAADAALLRSAAAASLGSINKLSRSKPSSKTIIRLVDAGTVIPDEKEGPYAFDSYMYHSNIKGKDRCYKNRGGEAAWHLENYERFAKETDWGTIHFETNGVDPDWMFSFGEIDGKPVQMWKLRPVVKRAQEATRRERLAREAQAAQQATDQQPSPAPPSAGHAPAAERHSDSKPR